LDDSNIFKEVEMTFMESKYNSKKESMEEDGPDDRESK
jgi:hypothetical protein